jgi:nucleotide-binding universal stress UspA family protein
MKSTGRDVERSNIMFQRILVPLDGSKGAERAIPVAAHIARGSGGSIVFIRVVLPPTEVGTFGPGAHGTVAVKPVVETSEIDLAYAASYIAAITAAYADDLAGIETETDVDFGAPSSAIFSAARYEHVDLIVMCSHGETGLKRWVLGSIAQKAVRHSPVPVLVLNEHGMIPGIPDAGHPLRVLVPLDGSPLSEIILEPIAHLIAALTTPGQGALHLVQVVLRPITYGKFSSLANLDLSYLVQEQQEAQAYLSTLADRLRQGAFAQCKLAITWSVAVATDVAGAIIKQAEQPEAAKYMGNYDLIAMATHGRGGFRRLIMGSVTEQMLGSTKLPLLIVRPHGIEVQTQQEANGEETSDVAGTQIGI